jgi:hypothetical protein
MKLVVISGTATEQTIWWRNLAPPIEDTLGGMADATLVRPPSYRRATLRSNRPAWLNAIRTIRQADVVFWIQMCLRPPLSVWALPYLRPLARRSVLAVDIWERDVADFARIAGAQRLDPCYVIPPQAATALQGAFQSLAARPLAVGYNGDAFHDLYLERDIDVLWIGRRDPALHSALLALGQRGRLVYHFLEPPDKALPLDELNQLIARSRYFVVTPPDLTDTSRTGSYSPLTSRYLEGIAAGARLLGVSPRSGELVALLGPGAIVECAPDGSDLEVVLDAAARDVDAEARRIDLRDKVVQNHSWQHRAVAIHDDLVTGQS